MLCPAKFVIPVAVGLNIPWIQAKIFKPKVKAWIRLATVCHSPWHSHRGNHTREHTTHSTNKTHKIKAITCELWIPLDTCNYINLCRSTRIGFNSIIRTTWRGVRSHCHKIFSLFRERVLTILKLNGSLSLRLEFALLLLHGRLSAKTNKLLWKAHWDWFLMSFRGFYRMNRNRRERRRQ